MRTMRMEREDIENSLKVLSHIVDDDFIITVDEARKIIRIDGETIEALQAELNSRTIYGYPVDKLIMFAEMCKRNDVREYDLKQAAWNLELAVRAVMNERQEIIKNAVGEITMRCTPDFEKAFEEMCDGANMDVQDG